MAGNSSDQKILYEEFEPFCKWQRKEDRDVLEIQLQDFKKEQLKVQISDHGVLKISGEREIDARKRTKFYKEVPAPATKYDTKAIHAKFVHSTLIITLPKPKPMPQPKEELSSHEPDPSKVDQAATKEQAGNVPMGQCQQQCQNKRTTGSRLTKAAASLAATAVVVVVLAAYVRYMYKTTVDVIDDN